MISPCFDSRMAYVDILRSVCRYYPAVIPTLKARSSVPWGAGICFWLLG